METLVANIQGYSIHDGPGIRTIVFLKGCNLACRWCSNPECISRQPEVGFVKALCAKCGDCWEACPRGALTVDVGGSPDIGRERCTGCGQCAAVCAYNALVVYGKKMDVREVFDAVSADRMFYETSGGGVTASGGEPLTQSRFVAALFDKCRRENIHTCLETSGCADSSALLNVLPFTDYVLCDVKHMDRVRHGELTGRSNDRILANAKLLVESNVEFLFRMPLLPGINDGHENIRETASFLRSLGKNAERIELMPYHRLGESKYTALGKRYCLHGLTPAGPARIEAVKQMFEKDGIRCSVSS